MANVQYYDVILKPVVTEKRYAGDSRYNYQSGKRLYIQIPARWDRHIYNRRTDADAILKVPGHIIPTDNPQTAHPRIPSAGTGINAIIR